MSGAIEGGASILSKMKSGLAAAAGKVTAGTTAASSVVTSWASWFSSIPWYFWLIFVVAIAGIVFLIWYSLGGGRQPTRPPPLAKGPSLPSAGSSKPNNNKAKTKSNTKKAPTKVNQTAKDKLKKKKSSGSKKGGSKPPTQKVDATKVTETDDFPDSSDFPVSGVQDFEGFQNADVHPISQEEVTLVNLQPLAIKDTGFLGPYPMGKYDPEAVVSHTLKAGFRFLTLQIDYMDSNKTGYGLKNEPILLIRDSNGSLLSGNSGDISKVATTIANTAFRPEIPDYERPIMLYLHINRAPNKVRNLEDYLTFLSKIARALNPLAPTHLALNPLGNFTRQKMESTLLTTPIHSLEGNTIILCNADTTHFRNNTSMVNKFSPSEDLDFWVNMRVYSETEQDALGISTVAASDTTVSAVVVDLNRVLKLSSKSMDTFAEKNKSRYSIAMGERTINPNLADINIALNSLGINAIPIDIFTAPNTEVVEFTEEYSNMSYHPKPAALRSF